MFSLVVLNLLLFPSLIWHKSNNYHNYYFLRYSLFAISCVEVTVLAFDYGTSTINIEQLDLQRPVTTYMIVTLSFEKGRIERIGPSLSEPRETHTQLTDTL